MLLRAFVRDKFNCKLQGGIFYLFICKLKETLVKQILRRFLLKDLSIDEVVGD